MGIFYVYIVLTGISKYGRSLPPSSSCVGTLLSLCTPPVVTFLWSLFYDEGFVIGFSFLGFLTIVLPLVCFACSISSLVFVAGLFYFCEVTTSTCYLPFDPFLETNGTLQSSGQYFMAHCTSSVVTQYLSCNHSLLGSLFSWIHILCLEDLKSIIH
jgi:hypothetical protein